VGERGGSTSRVRPRPCRGITAAVGPVTETRRGDSHWERPPDTRGVPARLGTNGRGLKRHGDFSGFASAPDLPGGRVRTPLRQTPTLRDRPESEGPPFRGPGRTQRDHASLPHSSGNLCSELPLSESLTGTKSGRSPSGGFAFSGTRKWSVQHRAVTRYGCYPHREVLPAGIPPAGAERRPVLNPRQRLERPLSLTTRLREQPRAWYRARSLRLSHVPAGFPAGRQHLSARGRFRGRDSSR
jgi:hypothetical protein